MKRYTTDTNMRMFCRLILFFQTEMIKTKNPLSAVAIQSGANHEKKKKTSKAPSSWCSRFRDRDGYFGKYRLLDTIYEKKSLQWRHNDHDSVSNHQPHGCLLNRLFRCRSKKTSKLRFTGLCVGNSPGPVNSPHKGPITRKMFPFDDVIMNIQR